MKPTLFTWGTFELHAYIFFLVVAFCVCVLLATRRNARRQTPDPISPLIGVWIFAGAILGARAFHVIQQDGFAAWREILDPLSGGLAFHGGLVGGFLGGWVYTRIVGASAIRVCDLIFPYLALGEAITRIGCFLNGCCWGTPTNVPWAVRFGPGSFPYARHLRLGLIEASAETTIPIHPSQLYMVVGLFALYVLLRVIYERTQHSGLTMLVYLLLHGAFRFVIEFFRADSLYRYAGLTAAQWISIGLVLSSMTALALLAAFYWRRGRDLYAQNGQPVSKENTEAAVGNAV